MAAYAGGVGVYLLSSLSVLARFPGPASALLFALSGTLGLAAAARAVGGVAAGPAGAAAARRVRPLASVPFAPSPRGLAVEAGKAQLSLALAAVAAFVVLVAAGTEGLGAGVPATREHPSALYPVFFAQPT